MVLKRGVAVLGAGLLSLVLFAGSALAQSLPVPRFVSMRTTEANVRTGPNLQYPIEWVFQRAGLPVEVQREHGNWRLIRDWQGYGGWVHVSQLSGRRTAIVIGQGVQPLLSQADEAGGLVARVEPGALGVLGDCPDPGTVAGGFCRVEIQGYSGWMSRDSLWGVYADETVD